jgi:phosphatidylserine decarboxylase
MRRKLSVLHQYALPKRRLTKFAGRIASAPRGKTTTRLIRWFVGKYGVDMAEAQESQLHGYATFNDFFTRALKDGARPLAPADLICPVDGAISQFGLIEHDQIVQAKGHRYSTAALVGGDEALADYFDHGHFATIYLSPKDYHRIHMPCDARLLRMIYVPGALFSVNPSTARGVPNLFARNERVVCVFEAEGRMFVMALVGATIVGSMATVWHGIVNAPRPRRIAEWTYEKEPVLLKQGDEMGRFLLGSTIVMLFPAGDLVFNPAWNAGHRVKLGEPMATHGRSQPLAAPEETPGAT